MVVLQLQKGCCQMTERSNHISFHNAHKPHPITFPSESFINSTDFNSRFADLLREVRVKPFVIKQENDSNDIIFHFLDGIFVDYRGIRVDLGMMKPKSLRVSKNHFKKYLRFSFDYDNTIIRNPDFIINFHHLNSLDETNGTTKHNPKETMLITYRIEADGTIVPTENMKDFEVKYDTNDKDMDLDLPFDANMMEEMEVTFSGHDKNGKPTKIVRKMKDNTLLTSVLSSPDSNMRYRVLTITTSNPTNPDYKDKRYGWDLTYDSSNNITKVKSKSY